MRTDPCAPKQTNAQRATLSGFQPHDLGLSSRVRTALASRPTRLRTAADLGIYPPGRHSVAVKLGAPCGEQVGCLSDVPVDGGQADAEPGGQAGVGITVAQWASTSSACWPVVSRAIGCRSCCGDRAAGRTGGSGARWTARSCQDRSARLPGGWCPLVDSLSYRGSSHVDDQHAADINP